MRKLRHVHAVFNVAHLTNAFFNLHVNHHGHVSGNDELAYLHEVLANSPEDRHTFAKLKKMDHELREQLVQEEIANVEFGAVADEDMDRVEKDIALLLGSTVITEQPTAQPKQDMQVLKPVCDEHVLCR